MPCYPLATFAITKTVISTPWELPVWWRNSFIPPAIAVLMLSGRSSLLKEDLKHSYHFLVCKPTMILHFPTREIGFPTMLLRFCILWICLEIFVLCFSLSARIKQRELLWNLCLQTGSQARVNSWRTAAESPRDLPISRLSSALTEQEVSLNFLKSKETSHPQVTLVFKNNRVVPHWQ